MTHPLIDPPEGPYIRQARMPVTAALIHNMLRMPEETRIVGATFDGRTLMFQIEDPRLRAIGDGEEFPPIVPSYETYTLPTGLLIRARWPFDVEVITGDVFPDDVFPDDDVTPDHPVTGFAEDSPRISGTDPDGRDV